MVSIMKSSWKKESEVAQSCPTLCNPMDCNPPDSSVHGIFQARVLEWHCLLRESPIGFFNSQLLMADFVAYITFFFFLLYISQTCFFANFITFCWNLVIIDNILQIFWFIVFPHLLSCFYSLFKFVWMTGWTILMMPIFSCHVTPLMLFFKLHRLDICKFTLTRQRF